MLGERLLDGQLAGGDPAGQVFVDGTVRLAFLPGAFLDSVEFSRSRVDVDRIDALALDPGDIDGREHVAHPSRSRPEVRRRPGLVDHFDGHVLEGVHDPRADESRAVADPDQRIGRVFDLTADHLADLIGRHLEGPDHHVTGEDGDSGFLARIDADDDPPTLAPHDCQEILDGPSWLGGIGLDDGDIVRDVDRLLGAHDNRLSSLGEFLVGLDRGERHAAVAQLRDHAVIEFEVRSGDNDHGGVLRPTYLVRSVPVVSNRNTGRFILPWVIVGTMNVDADELQTNETDDRGRIYLGTEYANKRVTVAVVDVESDGPDDDELAAAYRQASEGAAELAEEWDETSKEAWQDLDE